MSASDHLALTLERWKTVLAALPDAEVPPAVDSMLAEAKGALDALRHVSAISEAVAESHLAAVRGLARERLASAGRPAEPVTAEASASLRWPSQ